MKIRMLAVVIFMIPFSAFAKGDALRLSDADPLVKEFNQCRTWTERESLLKGKIKEDPRNAKLYSILTNIYFEWEKTDPSKVKDAEETIQAGILFCPQDSVLRNSLGDFYRTNKQYDKAEEQFKAIIEMDPDFAPVYVNYGRLERDRGNFKRAIEYFNKSILLDQKTDELSVENLTTVYVQTGHCYGSLEQYDDAINEYEKACQIKSSVSLLRTHNNLGALYLTKAVKTKDKSLVNKGQIHYEEALEISPNDPEALQGLRYVEAAKKKLGIKEHFTVKRSGNTFLVFPKENEREAENLKSALDKKADQS